MSAARVKTPEPHDRQSNERLEQAMAKVCWTVVTGASSGIGEALAREFAERAHNLVLVARRRERLEALAQELERTHGSLVEVIQSDLQDPAAPQALVEEIARRGLPIHTFINNAGFGLRGRFAEQPMEELAGMIELNVTALTKLCRLVLPDLITRREGGIINVASTAAFQAGPNLAVYYATKAYVLSLSEALHEEAKPHGVTVTALCPGPTHSEFVDRAKMADMAFFRRAAMSAKDVARAGADGYVSKQAIVIPGIANRLGATAASLLPRFLSRQVAGRIQG
jgi:uncharacterized protein